MGQGSFRGRNGTFSMNAPQGGGPVRMPLTVLDLPTMVEAYRTIDGKSGDYVKTADVSQIMLVHEDEDEAQALRARRPTGRFDSGITPPTHKITREFLRRKPHFNTLLRKRKYNLKVFKPTFLALGSQDTWYPGRKNLARKMAQRHLARRAPHLNCTN